MTRKASTGKTNSEAVVGPPVSSTREHTAQALAVGGLALVLVTAVLRPADSVEVERGAALFFVPLVVIAWLASLFAQPVTPFFGTTKAQQYFNGLLAAWLAWLLIGVFNVAGEGNVRHALNEFWWWVSGVLLLMTARNCLGRFTYLGAIYALLLALMVGVCGFAAHQQLVSLPSDRAMYELEPERVLAAAGIDAPPGSPRRMLFEARLYGGGVTGTFSLANSLAGFLVLCLPMVIGEIVRGFKAKRAAGAVLWLLVAIGAGTVLVWTDSRSAYLSLVVGVTFGFLLTASQRLAGTNPGLRFAGLLGWIAFAVAGVAVFVIALMPSLWNLAPRSLVFRFQYWNATLRMLAERPWFGAGPGNFQQRYGQYRLDEASEGIADPHNWIMEILGTGGFIGLILCVGILLIAALGLERLRVDQQEAGQQKKMRETGWQSASPKIVMWVVGLAAFVGVVGVIASWIATLSLPEFDALFLLVVATFVCFAASCWKGLDDQAEDWIVRRHWMIAGLTTIGIHLLASGGLTVPGVAVPMILIAGCLLSGECGLANGRAEFVREQGHSRFNRIAATVLAGVLLLAWQWSAWGPTSKADGFLKAADDAVKAGFLDRGIELYEQAAEVDRFDPQPLIRESETLLWTAVATQSEKTANELRARLSDVSERAIAREPASAQWHELRGRQRVVLYQRFGDQEDVQAARDALTKAIELAPGEVSWAAQLALVEAKLGNQSEAVRWAGRAKTLSAAGEHADRSLEVVRVLELSLVGEPMVQQGPSSQSAAESLRSILPQD